MCAAANHRPAQDDDHRHPAELHALESCVPHARMVHGLAGGALAHLG
jgi:hypothetical protein